MSDFSGRDSLNDESSDLRYQSFAEVTELLDVAPGTLRRWIQRFSAYLHSSGTGGDSHFSESDVETLTIVRGMLAEGNSYEQIAHRLQVMRAANPVHVDERLEDGPITLSPPAGLPLAVSEVVHTLADTQRSILNSQGTIRDLVGVVVQDNFNLKEENRKLRERMLEIERTLAEYQRREETRKERLEGRLRALEGTLGALQQQVAHWIQLQRQRRRNWFW